MKKLLIVLICFALVIVGIFMFKNRAHAPTTNSELVTNDKPQTTTKPTISGFDKDQFSTTRPESVWVTVNKPNPLAPINYAPTDLAVPNVPLRVPGNESMKLKKVVGDALEQMFGAAKKDGLDLMLSSGYRSYDYQSNLYSGYVASKGQAGADAISARPGYSEHQTGLAADIEPSSRNCEIERCFADTLEGKWLAKNAYKYGFIIRYPADKLAMTGYEFEPWHVRFVDVNLATEMNKTGITTLEEFFGISGGASY